MAEKKKASKAKALWGRYGFGKDVDLSQASSELPPFDGFNTHHVLNELFRNVSQDIFDVDEYLSSEYLLPDNRLDRYHCYDMMAKDPIIDTALNHHLNNALAPKTESGEILRFESIGEKETPEAKILREDLQQLFNKNIRKWMYAAIKNGVCYVRPNVTDGIGITSIRNDFYTNPSQIKEYEVAGNTVGYLHKTDIETHSNGTYQLFEPWKFIAFKMESLDIDQKLEPVWKDKLRFDIRSDDTDNEDPIESQNYGRSLFETVYEPYISLRKAMRSLDIAREKAGRKERFITVNTGNQTPTAAAKYYGQVVNLFRSKKSKRKRKEYETGARTSVENVIIPVTGEIGIQTEVNPVDIAHIEDMHFRVSLLAASLGIDKALFGFTEDLSGGLGDGGFFQVSLMAGAYANSVRSVAADTMNELAELHLFKKTGKVYPGELPWKIVFNSTATAVEREEQAAFESKLNSATMEITVVQTMDPEWQEVDRGAYVRHILVTRLGMTEEEYKAVKSKGAPAGDGGGDGAPGGPPAAPAKPPIFDSATTPFTQQDPHLRSAVYGILSEILPEENEEA